MWRPVFMAVVTAMAVVFVLDFVLEKENGFWLRSLAVFGFIGLQIALKIWNMQRAHALHKKAMERVMKEMFDIDPPHKEM